MAIDQNVSDLFFNTDVSDTVLHDAKGQFNGYDEKRLADEADMFLASLSWLGIATPSRDDLIADFYGRI